MISKIKNAFPGIIHNEFDCAELFFVDYSKSTGSKKDLEVSCEEFNDIKSFYIDNSEKNVAIDFVSFTNDTFTKDEKTLTHCEGIFFPHSFSNDNWLIFCELKYARSTSNNLPKAANQLLMTISYFRENGIIDPNKVVYAIVSFPEYNRTPFESFKYQPSELKNLRRNEKIIFRGVNKVIVKDELSLKV